MQDAQRKARPLVSEELIETRDAVIRACDVATCDEKENHVRLFARPLINVDLLISAFVEAFHEGQRHEPEKLFAQEA